MPHDDDKPYDPFQTTPRLPGEPLGNYELRQVVMRLHKRIDDIYRRLNDADAERGELLTIATNVQSDMRHFVKATEDQETRLRDLEKSSAKIGGIGLALGMVGGYISSFFHK